MTVLYLHLTDAIAKAKSRYGLSHEVIYILRRNEFLLREDVSQCGVEGAAIVNTTFTTLDVFVDDNRDTSQNVLIVGSCQSALRRNGFARTLLRLLIRDLLNHRSMRSIARFKCTLCL